LGFVELSVYVFTFLFYITLLIISFYHNVRAYVLLTFFFFFFLCNIRMKIDFNIFKSILNFHFKKKKKSILNFELFNNNFILKIINKIKLFLT
jgi:hypothetical protein